VNEELGYTSNYTYKQFRSLIWLMTALQYFVNWQIMVALVRRSAIKSKMSHFFPNDGRRNCY